MPCEAGAVEQRDDGRWQKCIGGEWMLISTPRGEASGVRTSRAIDRPEDLDMETIHTAIADDRKQVILTILDVEPPADGEGS